MYKTRTACNLNNVKHLNRFRFNRINVYGDNINKVQNPLNVHFLFLTFRTTNLYNQTHHIYLFILLWLVLLYFFFHNKIQIGCVTYLHDIIHLDKNCLFIVMQSPRLTL